MVIHFFFFLGGKGTKTPIHNGFGPTLFVQVEGQKKWTFYQPEDRFFLDVKPEGRSYYYSNANPDKLEVDKFPLFKYAKKHEVILNEGDILWFPPFAFHQVENVNNSIGVAYKYVDIPHAFKNSKIMAFLYFFANKPNIITTFFGNRMGENEYIFKESRKGYSINK